MPFSAYHRLQRCYLLGHDLDLLTCTAAQRIFIDDSYGGCESPRGAVLMSLLGTASGAIAIPKIPLVAGNGPTPRLGATGVKRNRLPYLNRTWG
jgi:hypothetical protein